MIGGFGEWLPSPDLDEAIVEALREAADPLTTVDIALMLGQSRNPTPVAYGVKRLLRKGAIEVVDSYQTRGITVRRYRLVSENGRPGVEESD